MHRRFRDAGVLVLALGCTIATVHLFSWPEIVRSLRDADFGLLLLGGGTFLLLSFVMRGLRWLFVNGIHSDPRTLWNSILANAAASGLAVLTPFQLGEASKVKLAPRHAEGTWRHGLSAFAVERALDLSGLLGIGLCGLALHYRLGWLAPLPWLMPIACGFAISLVADHVERMPARLRPYLEAFRHRGRILRAGAATIPLWLLIAGMWWCAVSAVGVDLTFGELCLLLCGVMLATVATMIPGGIGISELSARGIMLWLGHPVTDAEAAAIGLRLLSPLVAILGLSCLVPLSLWTVGKEEQQMDHAHSPPRATDDSEAGDAARSSVNKTEDA